MSEEKQTGRLLRVDLQAQPFAARVTVAVPAGLPPGNVTVTVTVDGATTNALPFEVTA